MLESKEKIIGGVTYIIKQMNGVKALKTQAKIIKIVGPALLPLFISGKADFGKESIEKIMPALQSFDDDEVVNLVLSFFEGGDILKKGPQGENATVDFDTDFQGKIMDVWQLVKFVLEVNFSMGKL